MSKHRYVGGIISATQPTPSQASASGVWTLDEAQYYQKSGQWPPGGGNDPYFQYNTLLLHGDGTNGAQNNTFLDGSANNFTITRNGNTTQGSFNPYTGPGCWSNYFPGSSCGFATPSSTLYSPGTGDFTLECWFYSSGPVNAYKPIVKGYSGANVLEIRISAAGTSVMNYYVNSTAYVGTTTIVPNTWYHVALCRSGGTIRAYVNGVQDITATTDSNNIGTLPFYIGTDQLQAYFLTGYISNVRFIKGTGIYSTTTITPPTAPLIATTRTTLLTCQSAGFQDNSAANASFTFYGTTNQVSKFSPFTLYQTNPASYSGYFDGTGDYLSMAASPSTALGSGDFTVEYWAFYNTFASSPIGFDSRSSSGDITPSDYVTTGGNLVFYYNSANLLTSTNAAVLGRWNHIAWVRAGNVLTSYINGVASGSVLSGTNFGNSQPFRVAGNITAANFLNGSISNFRVVKGTAIYTANFTPSTAALTTTTTVSANQSNSVSFDGNGDYLTLPTGTSLQLSTQDFTIEAWVYPTSRVTNSAYIISQSSYGVGTDFAFWITSTGILQFYMLSGGAGNIVTSTGTVPLNAWTHVAIVRSGPLFKLYINGTNDGSLVGAQNITNTYTPATIANSTNNTGSVYFPGQISNLRVTRGVAVYTTNFTPPTQALTATTTVPANQSNSVSFDGTGDYLSVPSNAAFGFGTGDFTIEYWVYATSWASTPTIVDLRAAAGTSGFSDYYSAGGAPNMYWHNTTVLTSSLTVPVNTWTHVAYTRASGAIKIFVNGALGASGTSTSDLQASVPCRIGATFVPNNFLTGAVSNLRITKGQALYTAAFTPSTEPLTTTSQGATAANVSLLTCQDRLLEDNSNNLFAVTPTGDARPTSLNPFVSTNGIGGTSYSGYFDGTGDYLTLPAPAATTIGTSSFTWEAWLFPTAVGTFSVIYDTNAGGDTTGTGRFLILLETSGQVKLSTLAGTSVLLASTVNLTSNRWVHVAITRSGTSGYMFFNGVQVATGTFSTNFLVATAGGTNRPIIGANGYNGSNGFSGNISNLRLIIGTALYTAGFSPSTTPLTAVTNTQLLTCQSTTFIDNSANAITITAAGNAVTDEFNPFSGATTLLTAQSRLLQDNSAIPTAITPNGDARPTSMNPFVSTNGIGGTSYSGYFSGSGQFLTVPDSAALEFGTNNFTIEMWLYTTSTGSSSIFVHRATGATSGPLAFVKDASNILRLYLSTGTASWDIINGVAFGTLPNNQWSHVAITRNGSNFFGFLNGVSTSLGTSAAAIGDGTSSWGIGADINNANAFPGYISNLRVVNGTAVYTSSFTPTTAPLTAITNTQLLTCQNTTFIDNSTNAFTITNTGTVVTDEFNPFSGATTLLTCQSTTFVDNSAIPVTITANGNATPKRANPFTDTVTGPTPYATTTYGGSAYFDGTGDYLSTPSSAAFSFGTGDFTVECWFNLSSLGVYRRIWWFSDDNDNTNINASNQVQFGGASQTAITGSTISANTWYHLAYVRSSGSGKLYLNGAQVGSTTANSYNSSSRSLYIGATSTGANPFLGYISDLRVVKGTAVYTGPFVPPAAPVTAIGGTQLLQNMTNAGIFDNTTVNDLETVGSAQVSTSVVKYGTGSIAFDGTGDYLTAPANNALDFGSGDFTIEGWVYLSGNQSSKYLFGVGTVDGATRSVALWIGGTQRIEGYFSADGSTWLSYKTGTTIVAAGQWNHVAFVRSGTTLYLFLNGTSEGTQTGTPTTASSGKTLLIGGQSALYQLNGYLDDIRITKGYARYTANFTPPIQAFPNY